MEKLRTAHPGMSMRPELHLRSALLTFNSKCNGRCVNCCGTIGGAEDMPLDKAKEVLKVLVQDARIRQLYTACLAEHTLYPHLNEVVRYIDTIRTPGLIVNQDTNGRLIPDGFIDAVNSVGYTYNISISIWGYDRESWNSLQGEGSFEAVTGNIRRYLRELSFPPHFSFPYITDGQCERTSAFIRGIVRDETGKETEIISEGADTRATKALKETGKIPVYLRKYTVPKGDYADVYDRGKKVECIGFNNCITLFQSFVMTADGSVYPCSGMQRKEGMSIGNVYDFSPFTYKDFVSLYYTAKAQEFKRGNFTAGEFASPVCARCSARIVN